MSKKVKLTVYFAILIGFTVYQQIGFYNALERHEERFNSRMSEDIQSLELSMSKQGFTVEQTNAVKSAFHNTKNNVSSFVSDISWRLALNHIILLILVALLFGLEMLWNKSKSKSDTVV